MIFCKAGAVGNSRIWGCVKKALRVFHLEFGVVKSEQGLSLGPGMSPLIGRQAERSSFS